LPKFKSFENDITEKRVRSMIQTSSGRPAPFRSGLSLVLMSLASMQSQAAQVLAVQVGRDDQRFHIDMRVAIDAAPVQVFRALQDYAAMPRYNPDLRAVRIEPTSAPNRVRLFTTIHTCVLLFCKTMHQEQLMTATAHATGGLLEAELIPHSGAFSGQGHWLVQPCEAQRSACLDIQLELVPQFWVPPVLGPWLIRRTMYEEAQRSTHGLEQVAQGRSSE
jgi:hypothetical protein